MTDRAAASYRTARELVTPQRLREFFAPRSIALVGASDNSGWARFMDVLVVTQPGTEQGR
jgi:hypothetical protein